MASEKQIAANRANALKSTGPRTPQGKRKVAQNPIKHGAYMNLANLLDLGERSGDLQYLHEAFRSDLRPHGATQEALVEQLAFAHFRIRRYTFHESASLGENIAHTGNYSMALGRDHYISHSAITRLASVLRSLHREFRDSLRLLREEQANEPDWLLEELEARQPELEAQAQARAQAHARSQARAQAEAEARRAQSQAQNTPLSGANPIPEPPPPPEPESSPNVPPSSIPEGPPSTSQSPIK
jgi:hypothetical protein